MAAELLKGVESARALVEVYEGFAENEEVHGSREFWSSILDFRV